MAGSYPDAPSRRMAWDADGSIYLYREATSVPMTEPAASTRVELNDEDSTSVHSLFNNVRREYVIIFPELREIDGAYAGGGATYPDFGFDVSADTTNGIDGSWTTGIASSTSGVFQPGAPYTYYRSAIRSMALSNKRAIMAVSADGNDGRMDAFHVYGEIAAGETPDRLLWIDNTTGLEFNLPIDYGDIPRGSAEDRELKLKNNSATLTAASVQITAEALYLNSGAWYTFSEGGAFQSTLALAASIGAGASTSTITIRRDTPDSETLGLHTARAYVNVGSWS